MSDASTGGDDDEADDHAGPRGAARSSDASTAEADAGQRGPARSNANPLRPPSRTMSEREVRGFLRDVLDSEWAKSNGLNPNGAPVEFAGESAEDAPSERGDEGAGETPVAWRVLRESDVEALEREGYRVRPVPRGMGEPRTATDSYAVAGVGVREVFENSAEAPERSVAEVLTAARCDNDEDE